MSGSLGDALAEFARLLKAPEPQLDLARACLMIGQDAYPDLEVERYLAQIDAMGERVRAGLAPDAGVEQKVIGLNEFLFQELGYWGNTEDYYDPRNSYLSDVIDRRTGIPITLSVLYMEVGRRVGLAFDGISFPGHFLVRLQVRGGTLILDPFAGGVPQSETELRERLQRVIPEDAAGGMPIAELPLDQFLEPATKRQILGRVLRNLKGIHREADEPERMLAVLNRMLLVHPDSPAELRDRGFVYQRLECWRPALQDLTDYLQRDPEAADVAEVRAALVELARRCARLN